MEKVYNGNYKVVVMVILNEVCPSDIFISCDPDKTSRNVELFFNGAQESLTL